MKPFLLIAILLALAAPCFAQLTEKIETDRPDQTESPFVVPAHYFQGEFGFNLVELRPNTRQIVHPASLLKYGIKNRLELRMELSPYTEETRDLLSGQKKTWLEPIEIGAKVRLLEEKSYRPKTSLIAHIGLPFAASKELRTATLPYTVRLTFQNTISNMFALGYNLGLERDVSGSSAIFYTLAPGFNLGERWYAYLEAFGAFTGGAEHNLDGGLAFYPSPQTKVDLSGGFGLGNSPLKNYVALGFSVRLPVH